MEKSNNEEDDDPFYNKTLNYSSIFPFYNEDEHPIFGEIDFNFGNSNMNESLVDSKKILNKLDTFESTYYKNIINFPNTEEKLHDKNILEQNLNLIEKTLPGFIICLLYKNKNQPISEQSIYELIEKNYQDLRKPNGSKYKGNIQKVFKSTLTSSFIFGKTEDGKWFYKEKEAIDYVLRVTEKFLTKKVQKDKVEVVMEEITRSTNTIKNIPKKKIKIEGISYKINKIYAILDDLLNKYKQDDEVSKILKNPFKNINSCVDLLQKIGSDNKCVGILMCFKFFKTIIRKFIKVSAKSNSEKSIKIDNLKIHDKINLLNNKIDYIEKYFVAADHKRRKKK